MAKNLLVLHIEVFTIYSKIKNPSYLDTDQETWSVRFPHDKQKKLQKMERWNVMVSSKENEQSEKNKN